jgi:MaoC dehydratase-like protein
MVYAQAALGLLRRRRPSAVPSTVASARGVTVDRGHLAGYDRVCGFRLSDTLPATYPHVLAFPLAMKLMAAPSFPIPLVGLVHLANRITVRRPLDAGWAYDLAVHAADLRPHERGRQLDVVAVATVDGVEVWRGVSTYLHKARSGSPSSRSSGDRPAPPAASAVWRVAPRVGKDYARVSGDYNPIHTSRLGARVLGFPRPIAHGMWSKARCLAALEGRLPDAYTVDVSFKLPVLLPATLAFSADPAAGTFALHDAKTGKPHLIASADLGRFS